MCYLGNAVRVSYWIANEYIFREIKETILLILSFLIFFI